MKKTLVALAVTAFAASASAVTVYENETTKFNFDGSVRVLLAKEGQKITGANNTQISQNRAASNLKNAGSRFNFSVKHNLAEDFYALGHYETRFGEGAKNKAGWGTIVTENAYVGLGGQGHQVTFGKQTVIGDDIGQAGFDKAFAVGSQNIFGPENKKADWGILTASSDSAVNYTYTGIEGLTLGANYNFANDREANNDVKVGSAKSGFGLGAIYNFKLDDQQALTFSAGYTHDDLVTGNAAKEDKDGVYFGAKYKVQDFTVAVDGGRGVITEKLAGHTDKTKLNYVRAGARYDVLSNAGVYANYSYGTLKGGEYKNTAHQYMLGSDYAFSKHVVTFVEGRVIRQKDTEQRKVTDKAVGVGLRVFW